MKIAAAFCDRQVGAGQLLERMVYAQALRPWHSITSALRSDGAALGYVRTSDRFSSVDFVREGPTGNILLISGTPIDLSSSLDQRLGRVVELDLDSALSELQQLDGAYAALLWHAGERKLGIVTDMLGMQPLYMHRRDGLLLLATELKAITATGLVPVFMDPEGWGAFLSFRHPIGSNTLLASVERAPAGAAMIYDPLRDELTSREWWKWPKPQRSLQSLGDVPAGELIDIFLHELAAYQQLNDHAVLCLSGGYDSRLILAGLAAANRVPDAICLSHADEMFDLDGKLAARVAAEFGAHVTMHRPDRRFFSSQSYVEYLVGNEVSTPSLYLFIAQLCGVLDPRMQAIWEGVFPGCIIFPIHQPPGGFEAYLARECAPFDARSWKAADIVFDGRVARQLRDAFQERLNQEKDRYSDDEFGVSEFIVRNRTRHRIASNPLQVYANDVLPFTPGLSRDFWSFCAGVPFELKRNHQLYQHIFRRFFPQAMKVPAVSGNTPYALSRRIDRDVLLGRFGLLATRHYALGLVLRKTGVIRNEDFWQPSSLVNSALHEIDLDNDELNADGIRSLRAATPPFDSETAAARELAFYCHYWRGILEGKITTSVMAQSRSIHTGCSNA